MLVGSLIVAHAISAVCMPILSGEAYYWLWGQHPAAGYVDHPPMVGWMTFVFGGWILGSPLAARSSAIVLAALSTLVFYQLARELYPQKQTAAWWAALLVALTPVGYGNGFVLGPDNPLLLSCALTWLFFWRAANRPTHSLLLWSAAGACAGLALLSKFHGWILLPPLWLFLMLSSAHRSRLKTPGPWLAVIVAIVVLSPNLIWNARHDWLTYAFQRNRSALEHPKLGLFNPVTYLIGPVLTLSPLVYAAMLWAVWTAVCNYRSQRDSVALYLLCAGLPLLAFLGLCSIRVPISPHWPMLGFFPLLILLAGMLDRFPVRWPKYRQWMMRTCFATTAVFFVLSAGVRFLPAHIAKNDKMGELSLVRLKRKTIDWKALGTYARELRDRAQQNNSKQVVLMANSWHLASLIAFHARLPQDVFTYTPRDGHCFELWRRDRGGLADTDAIVVWEKERPNQIHSKLKKKYDKYYREIGPWFEKLETLPSLIFYPDGSSEPYKGIEVSRPRVCEYLFFRGTGYKPPTSGQIYSLRDSSDEED